MVQTTGLSIHLIHRVRSQVQLGRENPSLAGVIICDDAIEEVNSLKHVSTIGPRMLAA